MLDLAFPDTRQFRLSWNEHRVLGRGLREHIRKEKLSSAFASKREWREALEAGEIWTLQTDAQYAASSFFRLAHAAGRYIPETFRDTTPSLPRSDHGLILSYDVSESRPWRLEFRPEQRHDRIVLVGMNFHSVLNRAFELNLERARCVSERFAEMTDSEPTLIQTIH